MIRQYLPEPRLLETAQDLEDAYLPPDHRQVRVNFVSAIDGAVEVGGRSAALGGPPDRAVFMAMRAVADAVMVGAGTARAENYGPVRLDADVSARREARGQAARPPLAVISAKGDLDPQARLFDPDGQVIIFTTQEVAAARHDLADVAEVVASGDGEVDLAHVLSFLHDRGLGRVLCEGGPFLTRRLLEGGLADELCLTIAPVLAGAGHRSLSQIWMGDPGQLHLTALMEGDGMIITRYEVESR
ncbi:MAG TPA: pyrimidine reductase family protein [Acidimicrobiales bacterium]|nr:pyrimidine reductase family protein [Acidimicrobiales bacterium]